MSDASDWSASTPTWGPLPCVITSRRPWATAASAAAAPSTFVRWWATSGGSPRRSRALPPSATTTGRSDGPVMTGPIRP